MPETSPLVAYQLTTLLSYVGPLAVVVMMIVLARLSRQLGAVARRPPHYRWFYVSAVLVMLSMLLRIVGMDWSGALKDQAALIFDVPYVLGLVLALFVAWHYWSWMLYEREREP